jgi:hypothetical protein
MLTKANQLLFDPFDTVASQHPCPARIAARAEDNLSPNIRTPPSAGHQEAYSLSREEPHPAFYTQRWVSWLKANRADSRSLPVCRVSNKFNLEPIKRIIMTPVDGRQ